MINRNHLNSKLNILYGIILVCGIKRIAPNWLSNHKLLNQFGAILLEIYFIL